MKILYCNKYNFRFSGTETYIFDAMELMRSHGHEAALFSMADRRGEPTPYDRHFVKHIDFKKPGLSLLTRVQHAAHAIYSIEARKKLRGLMKDFRPDVAHIRNIYHHLSPSILWELKTQGIPVLYHLNDFKLLCPSYNMVSKGQPCEKCCGGQFWNVLSEGCYSGPKGSVWMLAAEAYVHKWLRTYQKCVTRFLAPSQFVKDKLTENGWDADRIEVLRHFQRLPTLLPMDLSTLAPILYFGRLSPEKGIPDLLHAVQRLPEIPLLIAGEGPQRQELENLALSLNLAKVKFLGHLQTSALDNLISSARFTVLPSRAYETMGKTILESFANGRAVVASDIGSRRELVKDGNNGRLFRAGDVNQLSQVIAQLYQSPQIAEKMGIAAREYIVQNHSQASHYRELSRIYRELAPLDSTRRQNPAKPLRVAFIGGRGVISKYSGIETYYEEAGKELVNRGHEVTIYCRSYFTPRMATHNGMQLVRLPTIRAKHLETWVHTFLSTAHATFSNCDIVHYHALGPAIFSFVPRMAGKKTVVTVQGLDWQRNKWGWIASKVLRFGERASVRFPDATMVVSRTLEEHYRRRHQAKTVYVPNGASVGVRPAAIALGKWGLESGKYILFLGRFSPEKNCHLLIEAYEHIQTSVKLVLAGGSSYSDSYTVKLRQHQSDKIVLLDWLGGDDLRQILANALLFVLPSELEGLSLALLDAMGAGVCVLASDIPENRELVNEAGYTFKNGDAADLEKMLRVLIGSPDIREAAAKKARVRIQEQYLWTHIARQLEEYIST